MIWHFDDAISILRQLAPHAKDRSYSLFLGGDVLLRGAGSTLEIVACSLPHPEGAEREKILAMFKEMFPTPHWVGRELPGGTYQLSLPSVIDMRPAILLTVVP